MRDHLPPGPPWIPGLLRGMLAEFGHEVEQEAFAELQFRLPPLPPGAAPHGARFEFAGGGAPRFAPLARTGSPGHPPGMGSGAYQRESRHG